MRTVAIISAGVLVISMSWRTALSGERKIAFDKLPKTVAAALKTRFPNAQIKSASKEEQEGKAVYEVALKHNGRQYDVSLSEEGKITEIEKLMAASDLPAAVTQGLKQKYAKATIKKAEEITKGDVVTFEVVLVTAEDKQIEVVLDGKGAVLEEEEKSADEEDDDGEGEEEDDEEGEEEISLDKVPQAVLEAVKAKFAGAELKSAARETKDGMTSYEVSLTHKESRYDVLLTPEGKLIITEKLISASDLPAAVAKAIEAKYAKSRIKKAEELTRDGKLSYEALVSTADGKMVEMVLDASGKIIEEEPKK